jgi:cell division protein FtsW
MTFEHSMLRTATLCLIALGAIMVYSASSGTTLLSQGGDSSFYLKRYVASAIIGLIVLAFLSRHGLEAVKRMTPALLVCAIGGLVIVMVPGIGLEANGARRWLGAGPVQIQPSEVAKLALVLYGAALIAADPKRVRSLRGMQPLLIVAAVMAGLTILEPDLGTAIVIALTLGAILVVSGVKVRHLVFLAGALAFLALLVSIIEPYRRERLMSFLDPWGDQHGAGFQSVQAMIAIGSGGPFGVGLGESVQKLFYLPEAHTDMILAVIGEELGFAGIGVILFLYGMIAYAGLRAARTATDLYAKLVAAGITSVILSQATINFFAVLGLLPLTGVPLPFISYGNSSLIVLLAAMGILINIAQHGGARAERVSTGGKADGKRGEKRSRKRRHLRVVEGGGARRKRAQRAAASSARRSGAASKASPLAIRKLTNAKDRDRSRGNGGARGSGAGGRRRAAG